MNSPEGQEKGIPAPEPPDKLKTYLRRRYQQSSYANFLQMQIEELREGDITLSMFVRPELTNLRRILHGGAVGSLLDMAMNLACFSTDRGATILGFNSNFLRGCKEGQEVRAVARLLHNGRRTMVAEGRILDAADRLLAEARGTFFVTGDYVKPEGKTAPGPQLP